MRAFIILALLGLVGCADDPVAPVVTPYDCEEMKTTWVSPNGETFSLAHINASYVPFEVPIMVGSNISCMMTVTMQGTICGGKWTITQKPVEPVDFVGGLPTCSYMADSQFYLMSDDYIEICTEYNNCFKFYEQ